MQENKRGWAGIQNEDIKSYTVNKQPKKTINLIEE